MEADLTAAQGRPGGSQPRERVPGLGESALGTTGSREGASAATTESRPNLKGYSLSVTVEDGYYLKAYANPPERGIISYGFQATISRKGVRDTLLRLVTDYYEDNLDV